jgi:hypothetical protein
VRMQPMPRRPVTRAAVVALAVAPLSCGGGGGGSPTTPALSPASPMSRSSGWAAGTVVTVVSGETDAPLAEARVVVAGVSHATDEAGQAVVPPVAEGATVDVEAEGFLTRQTLVRHDGTRLTMWPDDATLPRDYTKALVYTASTVSDSTSLVPLERLPPRVHTLALVPSDAIAADARAMAAHRQGADYLNAALGGGTVFAVGGAAARKGPTRIDAGDASCEAKPGRLMARTWVSKHEVTRAEIVFCDAGPTRLAMPIAHELGHIFGLAHSPDRRDVMYPYYDRWSQHGFTGREVLTMSLVELRRGGNTWPDNDREAATSGTRVRVFVD